MADTTKKTPLGEVPSVEQLTQQARDFADQAREYSDQVLASVKAVGNQAVDAYEQVANSVLGAQHKIADSVKADWLPSVVPTAVDANLQFAEDVNAAYLKAARATLA